MHIQHVPRHTFLKVSTSNGTKLQQLDLCLNRTAFNITPRILKWILEAFRFFLVCESYFAILSYKTETYVKNKTKSFENTSLSDKKIVRLTKTNFSKFFSSNYCCSRFAIGCFIYMNNTKEVWYVFSFAHWKLLQLLTMI